MTITGFHLDDRRGGRRLQVWQAAPWERFEARGVIASALALAALTAAATAGGGAVAGAISSHGAQSAAETSARATSDATAAQLAAEREALAAQTKANEETLAYTKQQAGQSRADAETNREGDYEQWAAREGRLSTIGGMLGLPARQIPAYRPLGPEQGGSSSSGTPSAALMPKQGEVDWSAPADQLGRQLSAFFQARGASASEVPYWVQNAQNLVNRGKEINDPQYADKRLAAAEIFGAGGGGSAAPAGGGAPAPAPYGSIGSMAGYQPNTPAYVAPRIPMPGSIRQLAA